MQFRICSFLVALCLFGSVSHAQLIPLNSWYTNELNSVLDSPRFTAVKPLLLPVVLPDTQQVQRLRLLSAWNREKPAKRSFGSRLLNGHLLEVHDGEVHLYADPILTLQAGKSSETDHLNYVSTRGLKLEGLIGKRFSFGTSFLENQARFPKYVDSAIRRNRNIVPGEGMARNFKGTGFDYSRSDAYIAYTASRYFNAVLGYGKNFIGDGYRSLLLSDNSYSYPFLRLNASFWKINYTVLYNQYTNPNYRIGDTYQRKYATTHFLNVSVGKRWQLGLFENVIWQASDSLNHRGFELQYLNPILFLRPVEFSVGSPDNAMFGLTAKYLVNRKAFLYGQVMLDDFNFGQTKEHKKQHLNNKYGLQLGLWSRDWFDLAGFTHRIEYNTVRPYSYGHRKVNQNYTHYNQALAHPLGANFHEVVNTFSYTRNRWYGQLHSTLALIGEDYDGQKFGNNLWGGEAGVPMLGSTTLQGLKTKYAYTQVSVGWLVNPVWNMRLEVQAGNRYRENDRRKQNETFFNVGLKTGLWNQYWDF